MNKKGFTLIELLGVIILIGVVGLISVPAINSVISKQKAKNFRISVDGMLNSVKSDAEADKFRVPRTYLYSNEILMLVDVRGVAMEEDLQVSGKIENGTGTIKYDDESNLFVSIRTNKYCAKKKFAGELEYGTIENGVCTINNVAIDLSEE